MRTEVVPTAIACAAVGQQFLYRAAMYADVFRVHLVPGYFFAFHRFERARPDVERHFLAVDAVGIQIGQHAFCEMESGRGGSHAAFDFRVHRLVGRLVAFPVSRGSGRADGQFAHGFQNFSPSRLFVVPFKINPVVGAAILAPGSLQGDAASADFHGAG